MYQGLFLCAGYQASETTTSWGVILYPSANVRGCTQKLGGSGGMLPQEASGAILGPKIFTTLLSNRI